MHHCDPVDWNPERELDDTNLLTLCRRCHLFVGHLGLWSSYNPDVRQDAAIWRCKINTRPTKQEQYGY